ncbi:short-chain fatty acid transporter [Sutcliffiella horikoshii]|uniref:Short-chain fatty acid transporter n=1 Tax=Sutcliffiella horikoshii TaxID=79883 RepID=A0A5D4T255_9BACI|nr:TIGR00366 family protein [Sutcliffiella horikoshii]TYS69760.1 short-chain fatty acid transporter [Sutcliffiella horikoshii]
MRYLSNMFTKLVERYLPDSFIILFGLTIIVFILGLFHGSSIQEVMDLWGKGLFDILAFTMQATLMLVTGFALAKTPIVNRVLKVFARLPKTEVQVYIVTILVQVVLSWISWGFGIIAGAIVAREMGIIHRGKVHYPLVIAAAFSGMIVWHAGYGGTIPQLIATPGHFLEQQMGIIPVSETIFAPFNLILLIAVVISVLITIVLMRPKNENERISLPASAEEEVSAASAERDVRGDSINFGSPVTPAERLEESRLITFILGLFCFMYIVIFFLNGGAMNINIVIVSFLAAGLLFTSNSKEYLGSIMGGSSASFGIILQFPFYGGLMSIVAGTGIATTLANGLLNFATAETLPLWAFLSAGIINVLVPSGGGQWAVQGPIIIEAANQLGADIPKVAMAVAWGDTWTNLIQPFWTLALLAITGLGIRYIMGYSAVVMIVTGVVLGAGLLFI